MTLLPQPAPASDKENTFSVSFPIFFSFFSFVFLLYKLCSTSKAFALRSNQSSSLNDDDDDGDDDNDDDNDDGSYEETLSWSLW